MSRIGKLPISIPEGVEVKIDWRNIEVSWPKGKMERELPEWVLIKEENNSLNISIESEKYKSFWWLWRTLVANMVEWVNQWFKKELLMIWVWYNANVKWNKLVLNLWYSHPIEHEIPEWIQIDVEKDKKWNIVLTVSWKDKQLIWHVAAKIRGYRSPEPYKWKGIRYKDEKVIMKAGKAANK